MVHREWSCPDNEKMLQTFAFMRQRSLEEACKKTVRPEICVPSPQPLITVSIREEGKPSGSPGNLCPLLMD
jgi:hypothetical protein